MTSINRKFAMQAKVDAIAAQLSRDAQSEYLASLSREDFHRMRAAGIAHVLENRMPINDSALVWTAR